MSRGFRDWISPRGDDDAELDALLAGTWDDGAAVVATVLDIQTGKAALLAALREQQSSAEAAWHTSSGQDSAVAAVCEEADSLLAAITAEGGYDQGPAHSAVISQMLASRQYLIQLRAGLTRRSVTKTAALQLVGNIQHALAEANRTVQQLPAAGLAGADEAVELAGLLTSLQQRLQVLCRAIERLFDEADDTAPRVPAPHR
jgi:hypothetical protein